MRAVTVAENMGEVRVPGERHKAFLYKLRPGTAWRINDATRDHVVIKVDEKVAKVAGYDWVVRWIDGRSVAVFTIGETKLAQPVTEDSKARDRSLGSTHKRAQWAAPTEPVEPKSRKPLRIII